MPGFYTNIYLFFIICDFWTLIALIIEIILKNIFYFSYRLLSTEPEGFRNSFA